MHASATALRRPRSSIRPMLHAPGVGFTHVGQGRISLHVTVAQGEDDAARAPAFSPHVGRWLSNDPIGISGGLNQYTAFGNNPVVFGDPSGLVFVVPRAHGQSRRAHRAYARAVDQALDRIENALRAGIRNAKDFCEMWIAARAYYHFLIMRYHDGVEVSIGGGLENAYIAASNIGIVWDPKIMTADGISRPPLIGLAHEIGHAIQHHLTGWNMNDGSPDAMHARQMDAIDFDDRVRIGAGIELRDRN